MQTKEKIRSVLMEAYESLSPAEQHLAQLCSVIYEPVTPNTLSKIFRKAGLSFPGVKIGSAKGIEQVLNRLKALKLMDDGCQVAPEIIEIVTKRALADGRIYPDSDFLKGIESEQTWMDRLPAGSRCISCAKPVHGKTFPAAPGSLCLECAESELKTAMDCSSRKLSSYRPSSGT